MIVKQGRSSRYQLLPPATRAITALLVLRDHLIKPILAGAQTTNLPPKPPILTLTDEHYHSVHLALQPLFEDLGIAA